MAAPSLLTPTLHIEVYVAGEPSISAREHEELRSIVKEVLIRDFAFLKVGLLIPGGSFSSVTKSGARVVEAEVADYTGVPSETEIYPVTGVELDVQTYTLSSGDGIEQHRRGSAKREDFPQARVMALPNVELKDEWTSLVFEDGLPARLLRFMVRMIGMMSHTDLNASVYNWNKLCILHGPPGSGKSTLCRALAQKLSIRLGDHFPNAILVELDGNELLSKFFGESGKLVTEAFRKIEELAAERGRLVVVVIDEVETIAGSRAKSSSGLENSDGLRVESHRCLVKP